MKDQIKQQDGEPSIIFIITKRKKALVIGQKNKSSSNYFHRQESQFSN